jgi:hypothetical protein
MTLEDQLYWERSRREIDRFAPPKDGPATIPPRRFRDRQHHWLISERSSAPVISEWLDDRWFSAGERNAITPSEMYRRGWTYGGVCTPPKRLRTD